MALGDDDIQWVYGIIGPKPGLGVFNRYFAGMQCLLQGLDPDSDAQVVGAGQVDRGGDNRGFTGVFNAVVVGVAIDEAGNTGGVVVTRVDGSVVLAGGKRDPLA